MDRQKSMCNVLMRMNITFKKTLKVKKNCLNSTFLKYYFIFSCFIYFYNKCLWTSEVKKNHGTRKKIQKKNYTSKNSVAMFLYWYVNVYTLLHIVFRRIESDIFLSLYTRCLFIYWVAFYYAFNEYSSVEKINTYWNNEQLTFQKFRPDKNLLRVKVKRETNKNIPKVN